MLRHAGSQNFVHTRCWAPLALRHERLPADELAIPKVAGVRLRQPKVRGVEMVAYHGKTPCSTQLQALKPAPSQSLDAKVPGDQDSQSLPLHAAAHH